LFGNVVQAFHVTTGIQPKDLLRALQSTIEDRKKVLLDAVFVPNLFTIHLSRKDMAEIRPLLRALVDQLTVRVSEWIAQKGYATVSGSVQVEVIESPEMAEDEAYIEAVMQEPLLAGPRPPFEAPTVTAEVPVPAARPHSDGGLGPQRKTVLAPDGRRTVLMDRPVGHLRIVSGNDAGRSLPLKMGEATLGRDPAANILLQDDPPYVSRYHCALRVKPDRLEVADLQSTNGILIRGQRVKDAVLRHLETFQVGSFVLQFVATQDADLEPAMIRSGGSSSARPERDQRCG
jgi:pSer/pThr/pTyr-binding forkhead associated (FHA) protein